MFSSIFSSSSITVGEFMLMALIALVSGVIYAWLLSFKVRAKRRFFVINAIIPFTVGTIISFVNGYIGAGIAIGGAFALIRFRSAPGTADEIASILIAMAGGVAFGMGYVTYGAIILIGLGLIYMGLISLHIFDHKNLTEEKLLKITIPESLDYEDVFKDTFDHFLKEYEAVGVKTTGMGSMFLLSFRIRMKDPKEQKEMIDELRTKNGNLEIALLPYTELPREL